MRPREMGKNFPLLAPVGNARLPLPATTMALSRPKKNSTACLACKHAKRKCSGRPSPCKACEGCESECIFDETLDLRRRVAVKRTIGELEYHKDLLLSLLESIRTSSPEKLNRLLKLIRSNAPLPQLASAIASPDGDSDLSSLSFTDSASPESPEIANVPLMADEVDAKTRRTFISLEKLCDIPLFKVPAAPWTLVSDDDHLISHLVSLYFTWDHPFSHLIDQSVFLKHMASADLQSEFCTPFLVNCVLAVASIYSDFPEVFAVARNVYSRGQRFYQEAERLWKAEEGKVSLPNIQGVSLMGCFLNCQGKTNASWLMLRQAVELAHDFGMFQGPKYRRKQKQMSVELQRVSAITAWGIFILNSQMSMTLKKVVNLAYPSSRLISTDDFNDSIMWTPYPRSNQVKYARKPALLRCVLAGLADLEEIAWEIQDLLFEKSCHLDISAVWATADALYSRLRRWMKDLPDILTIDDQPVPQVLFLHIKCNLIIINLFGLFVDHDFLIHRPHPETSEQAKNIRMQSANDIAHYLRVHRRYYGLKHMSNHLLDATRSALFVLLGDFQQDYSKNALIELCQCLVASSTRLGAARDTIRMIKATTQTLEVVLPTEIVAILSTTELESLPEHEFYG